MAILMLNPSSGISGNMLLGALLDLGADKSRLEAVVEKTVGVCGCEIDLRTEEVKRGGLQALWCDTEIPEGCSISHGSVFSKKAVHVADKVLSTPEGTDMVRSMVEILLGAEARAHGEPADHVHLHELGSPDTIIDLVGCAALLESLDLTPGKNIYSSSVNVGGGTITTEHGDLPVPPPVTAQILKEFGMPFHLSREEKELTTPTGAVLLAHIVESYSPPPSMKIKTIGRGAGTFETSSPNLLQVLLCEKDGTLDTDEVTVLETNLDDITGEVLGAAIDTLMDRGAFDVQVIPTITKKNRPGHQVSLLCSDGDAESMARLIMEETGTLGVRVAKRQKRFVAHREEVEVTVEIGNYKGKAGVKISKDTKGNVLKVKAEFEDALRISKETGIPVHRVIQEIERQFTA